MIFCGGERKVEKHNGSRTLVLNDKRIAFVANTTVWMPDSCSVSDLATAAWMVYHSIVQNIVKKTWLGRSRLPVLTTGLRVVHMAHAEGLMACLTECARVVRKETRYLSLIRLDNWNVDQLPCHAHDPH